MGVVAGSGRLGFVPRICQPRWRLGMSQPLTPNSRLALRVVFPTWNHQLLARTEVKLQHGDHRRRGHAADRPQRRIDYQADSTIHLVMPQLTPQRDSRALAASSTASGSAFYDTRHPPSDNATVRGQDTGWQMPHTTDYRVRAADPTVIFAELSARFQYNKERTTERGKSTMLPKTFVTILRTSVTTPRTSVTTPRASMKTPRTFAVTPRISVTMPETSAMTPRISAVIPRTFLMIPGTS